MAKATPEETGGAAAPKAGTKYPRPKILVVDLPDDVVAAVTAAGYNAVGGTFGRPYRVEKLRGYQPVFGRSELPDRAEQEVVFVNVESMVLLDAPEGNADDFARDVEGIWAPVDRGVIDPRLH